MDRIATLRESDRSDLFRETAVRRGSLNGPLIEKDFWVCWTLQQIFTMPELPASMIFKGGTSLSKAFHAIERFSEDVDLSLSREDLGYVGDRNPRTAKSKKAAGKLIAELDQRCHAVIRDQLLPALMTRFDGILGSPGETWSLTIDENDPDTLQFKYPKGIESKILAEYAYVKPVVRLEMGARSDHWPSTDRTIRPYAADAFPEQFRQADVAVKVLAAERTFWDKAVVLHGEHHRPSDRAKRPDRFSRHYYDLARLSEGSIGESALAQPGLLTAVVEHQMLYFPRAWARYELAVPGSLRLLPSADYEPHLERDYRAMADFFFGQPPGFAEVVASLRKLESRINDQK